MSLIVSDSLPWRPVGLFGVAPGPWGRRILKREESRLIQANECDELPANPKTFAGDWGCLANLLRTGKEGQIVISLQSSVIGFKRKGKERR